MSHWLSFSSASLLAIFEGCCRRPPLLHRSLTWERLFHLFFLSQSPTKAAHPDLTTGAISPDRGISLMQFWQNSSVQLSSILLLKPQEAHTLLIDSMQLERHSGTFKTSSFKTFSFCLCLLEFSLWEKPVAT